MVTSTTALFLNTLTAFLLALQGAHTPSAVAQTGINIAENGVQLAAQAIAMPQIPFSIPQNDSAWPNMKDLGNAAYRDTNGNWVHLSGVTLIEQDTSFGDLNHDGSDDAAVVLEKPAVGGGEKYFLDAMLNQGGIMFDIAELPLADSAATINSHQIANGAIIIDGKQYKLFGTNLSAK